MRILKNEEPNRKKDGAFMIGGGLLFIALFSLILAAIVSNGDFAAAYQSMFFTTMLLFGAPIIITGGLIAFTRIDEDDTWKYGTGWYYATMLITRYLFGGYSQIPASFALFISGLIVFLVCVIIRIKTK